MQHFFIALVFPASHASVLAIVVEWVGGYLIADLSPVASAKDMESMEQNVGDFAADDLRVFEKVLGHKLQANQRVIIQVIDVDSGQANATTSNGAEPSTVTTDDKPPDWVTIFADVPDDEIGIRIAERFFDSAIRIPNSQQAEWRNWQTLWT